METKNLGFMEEYGDLPEYPFDVPTIRVLCRVCAVFDFKLSDCEKVVDDEEMENLMKDVIRHIEYIDSMHPGFKDKVEDKLVQDVSDAMLFLIEQMLKYEKGRPRPILSKLVVHAKAKEQTHVYVVKLHPY